METIGRPVKPEDSGSEAILRLGAPVVPFYPFSFGVPLLKPNSKKKGTLIIKGLLGNLGEQPVKVLGTRDLVWQVRVARA